VLCEKYDHKLQTVERAKGETTGTSRGAFLAALAKPLRQVGIRIYGGGLNNRSCKHIFSPRMQTFEGADDIAQKKFKRIIAGPLVNFTSVTALAPGGSDAARSLFDLLRALCDAKTLACGDAYAHFGVVHPNNETFSV
jgi:hypothetical protein